MSGNVLHGSDVREGFVPFGGLRPVVGGPLAIHLTSHLAFRQMVLGLGFEDGPFTCDSIDLCLTGFGEYFCRNILPP